MSRYDGRLLVLVTTLPDREAAASVAAALVREGLAACAQVGPDLVSWYEWEGEVTSAPEVRLLLKVTEELYEACARRLAALHPYEVPQVTAWRADRVGEAYGRWAWKGAE